MDDIRANLTGLSAGSDGVDAAWICPLCSRETTQGLEKLAGLPSGVFVCDDCLAMVTVDPASIDRATLAVVPEGALAWHLWEPFAEILTYRGVNLGEAAGIEHLHAAVPMPTAPVETTA